jgi:hypothetical protein
MVALHVTSHWRISLLEVRTMPLLLMTVKAQAKTVLASVPLWVAPLAVYPYYCWRGIYGRHIANDTGALFSTDKVDPISTCLRQ